MWLLPWFALAFPGLRLFLVFKAVEFVGFVARFGYLRTTPGFTRLPRVWLEVASAGRMILFVALVVAWIRRPPGEVVARDAVDTATAPT